MRKIAVVTGTRADYGLLYWIIKGIEAEPGLDLQLIVTGTHLCPDFGLTVRQIEDDGFPIAERVDMRIYSDTDKGIASSMGIAMEGFAEAYERLRPDVVVVLGDRFEILSAAAPAAPFRIPVAHIHGGETTEGAVDELIRHAVTKMSHIHFPATTLHAERIMQMGEDPRRVFSFGAPGLDSIYREGLLSREASARSLGLPYKTPWGVVTYHPETLKSDPAATVIKRILEAIEGRPDIYWVLTFPNADMENRSIITEIEEYVRARPSRASLFQSLGRVRYLSLLKHAAVMVGNSSSGIIEAPSFELPVVNIGERQAGRLRSANVIDVHGRDRGDISAAVDMALSKEYRDSLRGLKNPYGDGRASERIVGVLKEIELASIQIKHFYQPFLEQGACRGYRED